ncbi:MAG: hypothetical protein Q9187_002835 [Circinaria calcarea]
MDTAIASLLSQVHTFGNQLSSSPDAETRSKLRKAVTKLSLALEEPGDVLERISMQFMEVVAIRIAINLGLFQILLKSEKPKSLAELATETGADATLLGMSVVPVSLSIKRICGRWRMQVAFYGRSLLSELLNKLRMSHTFLPQSHGPWSYLSWLLG